MFDVDVTGTYERFGELVGVGKSTVAELVERGIILRGDTMHAWCLAYAGHLREVAAGRLAAGDLDLAAERARLAKEQADKIAMQNAVTRNELAPVYLIEDVLAKAGAKASRILDTIPGVIRRREPSLSSETIKAIEADVAKVRNLCAAITLESLQEEEAAEDQDSMSEEEVQP